MSNTVSREELITELRAIDAERTEDLTPVHLSSVGEYRYDDYIEEFGSFEDACEAAGIARGVAAETTVQSTESNDLNQTDNEESEVNEALEQAIRDVGLDKSTTSSNEETAADSNTTESDENDVEEGNDATDTLEQAIQEVGLDDSETVSENKTAVEKEVTESKDYEVEEANDTNDALEQAIQDVGLGDPQSASVDAKTGNGEDSTSKRDELASEEHSKSIPPEGRLDSCTVQVLSQDGNPESRRDRTLEVETEDGEVLKLEIWSKHDIDFDWRNGKKYELQEVYHKVWQSDGDVTRSLSSTEDLTICDASTRKAQDDNGVTGRSTEPDQDQVDSDDTSNEDGLVETIMKDIDLE